MMATEPRKFKKFKKKRVITEEQRTALVERLKKAREAKGPAKQTSIDASIRNLPDDSPFSPKLVREWIKNIQLKLKSMRSMKKSTVTGELAAYLIEETYLANLQSYLRTGVYVDGRRGPDRQHRVHHTCVVMAYYKDGTPKRSVGVHYPDIGEIYTEEMRREDNGVGPVPNKSKVYKASRKGSKRS